MHPNRSKLLGVRDNPDLAARFWSYVIRPPDSDCWEWTGHHIGGGYGSFGLNGGNVYAHRMAWALTRGAIPDDRYVLHRCDVRHCVRPNHLYLGTASQNMLEMWRRGRHPGSPRGRVGENHPNAKLSEDDVRTIRRLASAGVTQQALANRFGVTQTNISWVVRRKSWGHI